MRGALAVLHGNPGLREMLDRLASRKTLPHAMCFGGPRGVGKRTTALAVARTLQCLDAADADCRCAPCRKIEGGIHPDVRTIAPDGTFLKIDQIRELISMVRLKPYEGEVKFFILRDADAMNEESANAVLKTLEEPPPDTYLVLCTSRPDALLPTIRSRCRMVRFQALPAEELLAVLHDRGLADAEARRRAMFADGSVGTALGLDLAEVEARRQRVVDAIALLQGGPSAAQVLALAKEASADKGELDATMEVWKHVARDMALVARGAAPEACAYPDLAPELAKLAARLAPSAPLRLYREADALRDALRRNVAKQIAAEVLMLRARDLLGAGSS